MGAIAESELCIAGPEAQPTPDPSEVALAEELKSELENLDLGDIAVNELERDLFRYVRFRNRLCDELDRFKASTAAWVKQQETRIRSLDYVCQAGAAEITRKLLVGKKVKSVKTPFGVAGFRAVKELLVIDNEKAVVEAWERAELPQEAVAIQTKAAIAKEVLNKLYEEGEIPPGCSVRPGGEKFYVQ